MTNSSAIQSRTLSEFSLRSTRIARHSRVLRMTYVAPLAPRFIQSVDHGQHPQRPAIVGSVHDEVIGPDMVRPRRPQTDAGPVVEPQPASLGLLHRHFQPLPSPDAFDPLVVHMPALSAKQRRDPAVAVATVRAGQSHDGLGQPRLMVAIDTPIALRRAWLVNDPAHPTLG